MSNANPIELPKTSVKRASPPELIERVPALQREAAEFETAIGEGGIRYQRLNEHGSLILSFPRHHLVHAYGCGLATKNARREHNADLKGARRRFKDARINYENRVNWRAVPDIQWSDGGKFVSLSAILEARAEAVFWRKIVTELQTVERIKRQNARNIERARPEYVTIGGEVHPVSK